MNKKPLLPLLALGIIPVLALVMMEPDVDDDALGKQFAEKYPGATIGVHISEEDASEQEEVNRASLIIEGTILDKKPYWKVDDLKEYPRIFTDYTVGVDDTIKGPSKKTAKVTLVGGDLDTIKTATAAPELEKGDKVIMLLVQEFDTVFGDSYIPLSVSRSIYVIDENNTAQNYEFDRTGNKEDVKSRLAKLVGP